MNHRWRRLFVLLGFCCFILSLGAAQQTTPARQGWEALPALLQRINPPVFPNQEFDITKFGAVGDGNTDCSEAFKQAIVKCSAAGGGKVVVPQGVYLTGAIHLKSNVNQLLL